MFHFLSSYSLQECPPPPKPYMRLGFCILFMDISFLEELRHSGPVRTLQRNIQQKVCVAGVGAEDWRGVEGERERGRFWRVGSCDNIDCKSSIRRWPLGWNPWGRSVRCRDRPSLEQPFQASADWMRLTHIRNCKCFTHRLGFKCWLYPETSLQTSQAGT